MDAFCGFHQRSDAHDASEKQRSQEISYQTRFNIIDVTSLNVHVHVQYSPEAKSIKTMLGINCVTTFFVNDTYVMSCQVTVTMSCCWWNLTPNITYVRPYAAKAWTHHDTGHMARLVTRGKTSYGNMGHENIDHDNNTGCDSHTYEM